MTTKVKDGLLSIGQVVKMLKGSFPDLSISKVRFLEDEGLLTLKRSKGGYRLFSQEDIEKLKLILKLQKENFLPLAVIKEKIKDWQPGTEATVELKEALKADKKGLNELASAPQAAKAVNQVANETNVSVERIKALENFGLIKLIEANDSLMVASDDMQIVQIFAHLNSYGIEPRHLRIYENLAQKEVMLLQQILAPELKHKSVAKRKESQAKLSELVKLTQELKFYLLKKALAENNLL